MLLLHNRLTQTNNISDLWNFKVKQKNRAWHSNRWVTDYRRVFFAASFAFCAQKASLLRCGVVSSRTFSLSKIPCKKQRHFEKYCSAHINHKIKGMPFGIKMWVVIHWENYLFYINKRKMNHPHCATAILWLRDTITHRSTELTETGLQSTECLQTVTIVMFIIYITVNACFLKYLLCFSEPHVPVSTSWLSPRIAVCGIWTQRTEVK